MNLTTDGVLISSPHLQLACFAPVVTSDHLGGQSELVIEDDLQLIPFSVRSH